ncbi:lipoyl synthase [bacterium]|nr:lipoyl synthase [bacterium]
MKPQWFVRDIRSTEDGKNVRHLLESLGLNTVCREANCPNRNYCFNEGTATFLILGKNCTRGCRFCNISKGAPDPLDPDEPRKLAEAAFGMDLKHVVITSVTRDDLPDGGAGHFAQTIKWIRKLLPLASVELLIPDFQGSEPALSTVLNSKPDVLNHNVETVEELYPFVRPEADYERSLNVLKASSDRGFITKSGIMLGLGENIEQIEETFEDLADSGIGILTLGQYLAPSKKHYPVKRYIPPDEFASLAVLARKYGIKEVVSGPLVRSSYKAGETYEKIKKDKLKLLEKQGGD